MTTEVRHIAPPDVADAVRLVHVLAAYERAAPDCHLVEDQLHDALFGPRPALFGHVACVDGHVVGIALWFLNFSTWTGRHGIHLEDLVVDPGHRAGGVGTALVGALAAECVRHGYSRLEWSVLDWNADAIGFYRRLGAVGRDDWIPHRLDGAALHRLAHQVGGLADRHDSGAG